MDLSAFYNQFRDETAENIRALSDGLLALEGVADSADPANREHIDAIFRAVHTVKGSARLLGFEAVGKLAHTMEHILGNVREGRRKLDRPLADDMLRGGDAILELVAAAVENRPPTIDVDRLVATIGRGLLQPAEPEQLEALPQPNQPLASRSPAAAPSPVVDAAPVVIPPPIIPPPAVSLPVANGPEPVSPAPAAAASSRRSASRQTVRVRVDRLDRLINLTGELAMGQQVQSAHVQMLHDLQMTLTRHERTLNELSAELARLRFSPSQRESLDQRVALLHASAAEARQVAKNQSERMAAHSDHHALLIGDLEQEVMSARLLPVSTVFANMPRAVRELASELGKQVSLTVSGETTELDRKLLEALNDPLVHLVRNSLDHGIELPHERIEQGKPATGQLHISASALGGEVHVVVRDDGRGMDPVRLRETAVRKGLIGKESAALLSDAEALELVFLPGFSTAPIITDVSGRGVGMDVVRTNITELGGQTLIESQLGRGTTTTLVLPLTLVTSRVLLVELMGQLFGLPASGCRGIIWTHPTQVKAVEGHAMISYDGLTVPLLRLADLVGVAGSKGLDTPGRLPTVLIGSSKRPLGLLVDELYDEREVVVKPLGPLFEGQRRYSGAIQLGDGRLVLLLNPVALAQEARGMALGVPTSRRASRAAARLLVADDSFTTRELIRSILQSAGYDVSVAVDGHDALDKLRAQTYDLVVSDVEMPRVNGFQLTARIRQELRLTEMPVIIITSLASDDHKRQGLDAGAQAYIVKSQFNQDNLLDTIKQLLGR